MKMLLLFPSADASCAALAATLEAAVAALGHAIQSVDSASCANGANSGAMPDASQADLVLYLAGDTGTAATLTCMQQLQGMLCLVSAEPAPDLCPWALGVLASEAALAQALAHCAGPVQLLASPAMPAALAQQVLAIGTAAMRARPALAALNRIGAQLAHWDASNALLTDARVLQALALFSRPER